MKKFINDNNWWFYFVLTFLISWPVWVYYSCPFESVPSYNCLHNYRSRLGCLASPLIFPSRLGGVLEKRNDKWVVKKQHFSFATE